MFRDECLASAAVSPVNPLHERVRWTAAVTRSLTSPKQRAGRKSASADIATILFAASERLLERWWCRALDHRSRVHNNLPAAQVTESIKAWLVFGQLSSMRSVKDHIELIAIQPAPGDIACPSTIRFGQFWTDASWIVHVSVETPEMSDTAGELV